VLTFDVQQQVREWRWWCRARSGVCFVSPHRGDPARCFEARDPARPDTI